MTSLSSLHMVEETGRKPPDVLGEAFFKRQLPRRGPSSATLFIIGAISIAFGFYTVYASLPFQMHLESERQKRRMLIVPFLQAEEDRKYVEELENLYKKESEIMKDRSDWKVGGSPYLTSGDRRRL